MSTTRAVFDRRGRSHTLTSCNRRLITPPSIFAQAGELSVFIDGGSSPRTQRKLRQPIPQIRLKPLGIGLVFKPGDDVIGITYQDDVPLGMVARHRSAQRSTP